MLNVNPQQFGMSLSLGREAAHDPSKRVKIAVEVVNFWYGAKHALKDINLTIHDREITALIGPSGCGKTTLLRCLNRTHDFTRDAVMTGRILLDGEDINAAEIDPPLLRRRFGWVAQRPNPFPWSIYENVAAGPRLHGLAMHEADMGALVEHSLRRTGLWNEVKDILEHPGTELSVGQQQRLCIARAIAANPEVLLLDEPASALDPGATALIENLLEELRDQFTIVIVTHNMQQAARISQTVAMFHLGRLVEVGDTREVMCQPREPMTAEYIMGRSG